MNVDVTSMSGNSEDMVDGVSTKDCAGGGKGVATSAQQCVPGATLGNVRSEKGNYRPGADELNLIQDNLFGPALNVDITGSIGAGVIGSRPVSAATTSQVTGNAVVPGKPVGGPYTFTNQPNLFTSPFEEYVKVLIRSEMANGGMPSNEPFQDSPSIIRDLKKQVNKVVRKNF